MKISEITYDDETEIYTVTRVPKWWIESLFGLRSKIRTYKKINENYRFFDSTVYVDSSGEILGPMHYITEALDNWNRRF